MERLWEQFSPRLSASYSFNEYWSWNFNIGRFFQLPPYTVLGYRNPQGAFVNRDNAVRYIQSDHLVSGFEYRLPSPSGSKRTPEPSFFCPPWQAENIPATDRAISTAIVRDIRRGERTEADETFNLTFGDRPAYVGFAGSGVILPRAEADGIA
ncbi:MAG: hypothetical protein HC912_12880, partial [Saprospiraceae bacterium]|nr:hypothetical protein [Saprospiraceae bacterium]